LHNPDRLAEYRKNARILFEAEFNAERNHEMLMEIYHAAIEDFRHQKNKRLRKA
jgi:hypothetical protein